jgi:hypothetical protein
VIRDPGGVTRRDRILAARLQRQRSLAGGRRQILEPEAEGDLALPAQTAQTGKSQHHPVELALRQPAQARIDVAVQLDKL